MEKFKLSDYVEFNSIQHELSYYRIIPHQSNRNYKSIEIANVINRCYKEFSDRIKKLENDFKYQYSYQTQTKVAYFIYLNKKEVSFYLIIPKEFKAIFLEKLSLTWDRVDVHEVHKLPTFSENCTKMSMQYTKDSALSLDLINKSSNDLLSSQLNVINMLSENDKLGIYYNFNYKSSYQQLGFKTNYNKALERIKDGGSLDKIKDSKSMLKCLLSFLVMTCEEITGGVSELLGNKKKPDLGLNEFKKSLGILQKKDLSKFTKSKGQAEIVSTQILLMSESEKKDREKLNIKSLSQSFTVLDGDNELRPKTIGIKRKIDLNRTTLPIPKNDMSVEEVSNFIVQPGKELIKKYNIKANTIIEEKVPDICQKGYIKVGTVQKDTKITYLNPDPDQDTGLVLTGKQGSGKTEFAKNYSIDGMEHGDSIVLLDFIGNNDLGTTVELATPKEKLVLKDLSKVECMEAIAYNEKYYTDMMETMEKLDVISEKTQLVTQLINSFNFGQDLTSAMRRFFVSAGTVTYAVNQYASFRDVIDCLEFYKVRMDLIERIPDEFKPYCEKHVQNLLKLNDKYSKGDEKGQENGETCESKIERILDRVSVMAESPRLEYMLQKDPLQNINFEECFNEGKVIIIKMRQDKFGSEHMRNMLTLYFITRVWEACVNRYSKSKGEELRRVHFIIDEPHQVPIVTNYLKPKFAQMRKFRLKPVFATHSLLQLDHIMDDLKSAGFSYMLLAGSDKINFNILKDELTPYEVEDLLELERFHSLNLIPDEKGVLRPFISHLPPKTKVNTT